MAFLQLTLYEQHDHSLLPYSAGPAALKGLVCIFWSSNCFVWQRIVELADATSSVRMPNMTAIHKRKVMLSVQPAEGL